MGLLLAVLFGYNWCPWAIPLSILTDMSTLFLYIRCLKIVPVRYVVLTLDEFSRRALFFVSAFACFFLNIFALSNVEMALYEAILFTLLLGLHLDFTIPVETASDTELESNRTLRMAREYRSPSVAFGASGIGLIFMFFYVVIGLGLVSAFYYTVIGLLVFRLVTMSLCLCAVVCSERTSFAQKHSCERLTCGLNWRSSIVRYWAYSDLLVVACDENRERRRFLFDDDGDRFKDVAHRIIELIDSFTLRNKELGEKEFEAARAKKVAAPGARRRVVNNRMRMKPVQRVRLDSDDDDFSDEGDDDSMFVRQMKEQAGPYLKRAKRLSRYFLVWATNSWKRFWHWWSTRKERTAMEDIERLALQNGILVDKAIKIITQLVLISPEEDIIGVVPQRAEEFLDALFNLRRALGKSSYHEYVSPPFRVPWAFESYQDMAESIRKHLDAALEEILTSEYSSQFDTTRLKKKNRDVYELFGALNTKDRRSQDAAVEMVFEDETMQESTEWRLDIKEAGKRLLESFNKFKMKWGRLFDVID